MAIDLAQYDKRAKQAVKLFWGNRNTAAKNTTRNGKGRPWNPRSSDCWKKHGRLRGVDG